LAIGAWLAKHHLATAMMDLSDSLSSDLPRLCAASGAGARILSGRLPCTSLAERDKRRFDASGLALHGGDDYELMFTVAKRNIARIPKYYGGAALTQIGVITAQKKILLVAENGASEPLRNRGWDPFRL
jgi:thiamine-monophosphate kinase